MEEWLDDNDILPYLTHSKGKSVVAERFVKRLRVESKKKIASNDRKSYFRYLKKLLDQYNNTYLLSVCKKSTDIVYSGLT